MAACFVDLWIFRKEELVYKSSFGSCEKNVLLTFFSPSSHRLWIAIYVPGLLYVPGFMSAIFVLLAGSVTIWKINSYFVI